jgi:hypothetical protein
MKWPPRSFQHPPAAAAAGGGLAVVGEEAGLGVERIHVRHAAAHVEEDDALGLGDEVRRARQQ